MSSFVAFRMQNDGSLVIKPSTIPFGSSSFAAMTRFYSPRSIDGVRWTKQVMSHENWSLFTLYSHSVNTHTHTKLCRYFFFKPSHLHGKQWAHIVRVRHRRLIIAMNVPSKLLFFSPTWAKNDRILFQRARTIEWLSMRMNMRQNTF